MTTEVECPTCHYLVEITSRPIAINQLSQINPFNAVWGKCNTCGQRFFIEATADYALIPHAIQTNPKE